MIKTGATLQAIITKFLGPTNSRGSRVKATAEAGSVTVPWDYDHDQYWNHTNAAKALAEELGWKWEYVGGWHERGMVFVVATSGTRFKGEGNQYVLVRDSTGFQGEYHPNALEVLEG